jgi:hypothetical protein
MPFEGGRKVCVGFGSSRGGGQSQAERRGLEAKDARLLSAVLLQMSGDGGERSGGNEDSGGGEGGAGGSEQYQGTSSLLRRDSSVRLSTDCARRLEERIRSAHSTALVFAEQSVARLAHLRRKLTP